MLDELLKEIEDLKTYKIKYKNLQADKQKMSDMLYELMLREYETKTYEQRVEEYRKNMCQCCKFNGCACILPQDIGLPIQSNEAWIPATKGCKEFEWD